MHKDKMDIFLKGLIDLKKFQEDIAKFDMPPGLSDQTLCDKIGVQSDGLCSIKALITSSLRQSAANVKLHDKASISEFARLANRMFELGIHLGYTYAKKENSTQEVPTCD